MKYIDRLPIISPGTLIATSRGVASFITMGYIAFSSFQSKPLLQVVRDGKVILEPSDEFMRGNGQVL